MRVVSFVVVVLLTLLCAACNADRGGLQDPRTVLAPETASAPEPPADLAAQPVQPVPALAGFPAPSELRQVSWNPLEQLAYGSLYVDIWPHANMDCPNPPLAEFSSQWQQQAAPVFDDLAYALYAMEVAPDSSPVLATSWTTPPEALGCYIGLANNSKNAWDWYACEGEDISLPPLAPYLNESNIARLAVVVLEQGPLELHWLRIGDNLPPEVRLEADAECIFCEDTVNFDLGKSIDPERDIALYEFDFDGDGTYESSSPDVPTSDCTYMAAGTYTVVGRVTDGDGASATDETTVYVSGFTPQLIDPAGYSPSIAIDPVSDIPKISYSGGATYNVVRLATLTDPVDIRNLTSPGNDDLETALLITPTTLEVAFGSVELLYHYEGEFNDTTMVDFDKGGGKPAITRDDEGETSIFYSHLEGSFPLQTAHLYRAYGDIASFSLEQLDADEPTGRYCDAVYEGYLTCAYAADQGQVDGRLQFGFYSTITGWSWLTARDDMYRAYNRVSLAIDPDSHAPCLAYVSDPTGGGGEFDATYAWYADDAWHTQVLELFGWNCDLKLDAAGNPHVIVSRHYINPDSESLWYHWFDGADWHREFVANPGEGELGDLELALDATGQPHICWAFTPAGESASQLWYATEQ